MAGVSDVAVYDRPFEIFTGWVFRREWDLGASDTAPAEDLSDFTVAEFRILKGPAQELIVAFSIESGHMTIEDDLIFLDLAEADTSDLTIGGDYTWTLAIGGEDGLEGVARGPLQIRRR